jgi:hypothetical protein
MSSGRVIHNRPPRLGRLTQHITRLLKHVPCQLLAVNEGAPFAAQPVYSQDFTNIKSGLSSGGKNELVRFADKKTMKKPTEALQTAQFKQLEEGFAIL